MFAEDGSAGVAFRTLGPFWLALGDPAGSPPAAMAAVWRFRDLCERQGVEPAFWDVGQRLQRAYADIGLTVMPHGGHAVALRAERDLARLAPLLPDAAEGGAGPPGAEPVTLARGISGRG